MLDEHRLQKAVKELGPSNSNNAVEFFVRCQRERADFAARLLVLEPWAEKAMKVLEKNQYKNNFKRWLCIECRNEKGKPCAPDCAIAELLRDS